MEEKIRLVAAFKGLKFFPRLYALGHNNINPKLILRDNEIEFKNAFFTQKKDYEQIQEVGVYMNKVKFLSVITTNIILVFKDSLFTFSGNTSDLEELKRALLFFQEKHCQLSLEAQELVLEASL